MAERVVVCLGNRGIRVLLIICIFLIMTVGFTSALNISVSDKSAVQHAMQGTISPNPTPATITCPDGYQCLQPAGAPEDYIQLDDPRPCGYVAMTSVIKIPSYCYRPALSTEAIAVARKMNLAGTIRDISAIGTDRQAVAAEPGTAVCSGDGMTYCAAKGCVDLQNDTGNCGSCGISCINATGCRNGKCYTAMPKISAESKPGGVPAVQVNSNTGMERKPLNPQPVPPGTPVQAGWGSEPGNDLFTPLFRLFNPAAGSQGQSTPAVSGVNRNRGILESIFAIFSPVKDQPLSCSRDTDCPTHLVCEGGACAGEFVTATPDKHTAAWGDIITFSGNSVSNPLSTVCMDVFGQDQQSEALIIAAAVQPRSDSSFEYAWDTSQPLSPGFSRTTTAYIVKTHLGDCTSTNYVKVSINFTTRIPAQDLTGVSVRDIAGTCGPDQVMKNGVCVCIEAMMKACGADCANLLVDPQNCGDCGVKCGGDQKCSGGMCACNTGGEEICNGRCTDLRTDARNCGICGNNCQQTRCVAGSCGGSANPDGCPPGALCYTPPNIV